MTKVKPKERVRKEEKRLQRMHETLKNRALYDRERAMRELRSARLHADQMENYLTSLNSGYRNSLGYQRRIQTLMKQAYRPTQLPIAGDALRYFPASYPNLRHAVQG